jgi:hypothetical protein
MAGTSTEDQPFTSIGLMGSAEFEFALCLRALNPQGPLHALMRTSRLAAFLWIMIEIHWAACFNAIFILASLP